MSTMTLERGPHPIKPELQLPTQTSCQHISKEVQARHVNDPLQPSFILCEGCCHLQLRDEAFTGFALLDRLQARPPMVAGDRLWNNISATLPAGFRFGHPYGNTEYLSIYPPEADDAGPTVGSYGIVRQTEQGLVLLYPGSETRWHQQVLDERDVAIVFGLQHLLDRQTRKPLPHRTDKTFDSVIHEHVIAGGLVSAPKLVLRSR